jgi:hypothetical protein
MAPVFRSSRRGCDRGGARIYDAEGARCVFGSIAFGDPGDSRSQFEQAKGPKGERGLQGDRGEPGVPGARGDKAERGEKGEKGDPSAPCTLPIVNAYRPDAVHNEGDVVVQLGATWQALGDTGRAPPHGDDWICLAAAGIDASPPTIRGTYDAEARYQHLDIVARGGSSSFATAWSHRYGHSRPTHRLILFCLGVQIIWTGASELLGTVTLQRAGATSPVQASTR